MFTHDSPVVQQIDRQISEKRTELQKLESARNLLITGEPEMAAASVASTGTAAKKSAKRGRPALKGKRGRKRGMKASDSSTTTEAPKRKRGRPKGSKNKPKPGQNAPAPTNQSTNHEAVNWANDGQ